MNMLCYFELERFSRIIRKQFKGKPSNMTYLHFNIKFKIILIFNIMSLTENIRKTNIYIL